MADITDIASEKEQAELEARLANHHKQQSKLISRFFCMDCGEIIPPERRALGGKSRCLSCQQDHEHKSRNYWAN